MYLLRPHDFIAYRILHFSLFSRFFVFFYFSRRYHISPNDFITLDDATISPDIVQLPGSTPGAPTRFFARIDWDATVALPVSYRTIKLTFTSQPATYYPFPNFMFDNGGISSWMDWRDILLPGGGTAKVLKVQDDFDMDSAGPLDTWISMFIDTATWLQVLTLDRPAPVSRPSGQPVAMDIDTPIKHCFEKIGKTWVDEIVDAVGKKNRNDFFRNRDAENKKRLDDQERELAMYRQFGNPAAGPYMPPPQPMIVPAPQPVQPTPPTKRKKKPVYESDSSSSSDDDLGALAKQLRSLKKKISRK